MSFLRLAVPAVLLSFATAALAADPASGELNTTSLVLEWSGSGPYVFPNVTPVAGDPVPVVCEPSVPVVCDQFTINISLPEEFRSLPENQRESVNVAISFPASAGVEDYDLYLHDAAGTLIGESATGGQEAITLPLKTMKDGTYVVTVIPFLPLATNYTGKVQVGRGAPDAPTSAFSLAPIAGAAPLTVNFDARALGQAPAGGYVFDFGDGSLPVTDADGVIEHTYTGNGQYLSRVRYSDDSAKGLGSASQTVFVGEVGTKSGGQKMGGALDLATLLGLLGFGALARRRAH